MKKSSTLLSIKLSSFIGAIIVFYSTICANADQLTNHLFETRPYEILPNGYIDIETSRSQFIDLFKKGLESKYGHELLPSSEDQEGNWGTVTNGIQLSIRFYQTNFTNGEPTSVVVLWRNVGDVSRSLNIGWGFEYYFFDFILSHNGSLEKPLGPRFDPNWREHFTGGPGPLIIEPRNQRRFVLRLDKIFDLKPGAYEVSAKRDNAESGTAKFWVFPKAETQTNNPAGLK